MVITPSPGSTSTGSTALKVSGVQQKVQNAAIQSLTLFVTYDTVTLRFRCSLTADVRAAWLHQVTGEQLQVYGRGPTLAAEFSYIVL